MDCRIWDSSWPNFSTKWSHVKWVLAHEALLILRLWRIKFLGIVMAELWVLRSEILKWSLVKGHKDVERVSSGPHIPVLYFSASSPQRVKQNIWFEYGGKFCSFVVWLSSGSRNFQPGIRLVRTLNKSWAPPPANSLCIRVASPVGAH